MSQRRSKVHKAYITTYDDKQYQVFESEKEISVYQDHMSTVFSDGEQKDVSIPSWSFKTHRLVEEGETDYFVESDLENKPSKIYRISLRYATELVNYDFKERPTVRVVELPMSFIIEADGQTVQVIVHENLWFVQSGWVDV